MSSDSKIWQKKVKKFLTSEKLPISGPAKGSGVIGEIFKNVYGDDVDIGSLYDYGDKGLKYFDALAPYYDTYCFFPEVEVDVMALVAERIQKFDPRTVLDAGCTTGIATVFFAEHFPSISFFASDYSEEMLARTEERIMRRGIRNIKTILADHENLIDYIEQNSLDMVVTMGSALPPFENSFRDFSSILQEIMAPGGIYISAVPPAEISPVSLAEKLHTLGFAPEGEIKILTWKHGPLAYIFTLRKV